MNQVVANITVVFCVAACIAGGIFAWWVENRPGDDGQTGNEAEHGAKDNRKEDPDAEDKSGKK